MHNLNLLFSFAFSERDKNLPNEGTSFLLFICGDNKKIIILRREGDEEFAKRNEIIQRRDNLWQIWVEENFFAIHYAYCCELFTYLILFEFPWWRQIARMSKDEWNKYREGWSENSREKIIGKQAEKLDKSFHFAELFCTHFPRLYQFSVSIIVFEIISDSSAILLRTPSHSECTNKLNKKKYIRKWKLLDIFKWEKFPFFSGENQINFNSNTKKSFSVFYYHYLSNDEADISPGARGMCRATNTSQYSPVGRW